MQATRLRSADPAAHRQMKTERLIGASNLRAPIEGVNNPRGNAPQLPQGLEHQAVRLNHMEHHRKIEPHGHLQVLVEARELEVQGRHVTAASVEARLSDRRGRSRADQSLLKLLQGPIDYQPLARPPWM